MNWQSVSFDWNQARAFLATVEEGSLSAAARALGQTQPTLGRQVTALEEHLNIVLFERMGRSLVLTQSGIELLDHVRAMSEAANRISLAASGQSQTIEGLVRITASEVLSAYLLPTAMKKLHEIAPLMEIDVVATSDIRDLQLREADIAIRHKRPEQGDLIARLVNEGTAHFYASKSYLDQHGRPGCFDEMSDHAFVGFGNNDRMIEYLNPLGLSLTTKNFKIGSKNGLVAWEMAQNDLGIIVMSDGVAEMTPGMERVLLDMEPIVFPIWLTTHRELHTSRRIRIVFDLLAEFLAGQVV